MLEGFATRRIDTGEASIQLAVGGAGPPLLLLHGYPETHVCWHRVAPRLARSFTVVCPDLRGYGESRGPATDTADHAAYSKRAMARDQVAVMTALGFERFGVTGHDRGGRVAYRLALDHPERVSRLALLDIVPTGSPTAAITGSSWPSPSICRSASSPPIPISISTGRSRAGSARVRRWRPRRWSATAPRSAIPR
jgi:pimeloyl-ACP methyl ester carboxylesterase